MTYPRQRLEACSSLPAAAPSAAVPRQGFLHLLLQGHIVETLRQLQYLLNLPDFLFPVVAFP
jgi:hypothetical protein